MGTVMSEADVESFIANGFIKVDAAFPEQVARDCRAWLWEKTGLSPNAPDTWTEAKIWLPGSDAECFRAALRTPRLTAAFDDLAGRGRWQPFQGMGIPEHVMFPIRFPNRPDTEPDDKDWHIEACWGDPPRTNLRTRGLLMFMLFLFSDVGPDDGATRIKIGSHLEVARLLEPFGDEGVVWPHQIELATKVAGPEALATGRAGDVYLCHRLLAHAAAPNVGTRVRFLGQPSLVAKQETCLNRTDGTDYSPVEIATRRGLGWDNSR
jgi:hypothetical protein